MYPLIESCNTAIIIFYWNTFFIVTFQRYVWLKFFIEDNPDLWTIDHASYTCHVYISIFLFYFLLWFRSWFAIFLPSQLSTISKLCARWKQSSNELFFPIVTDVPFLSAFDCHRFDCDFVSTTTDNDNRKSSLPTYFQSSTIHHPRSEATVSNC